MKFSIPNRFVLTIINIFLIIVIHGRSAQDYVELNDNPESSMNSANVPSARNEDDGVLLVQNDGISNILVTVGYYIDGHTETQDTKVMVGDTTKCIIPSSAKNIALKVEQWSMFAMPLPGAIGILKHLQPHRKLIFQEGFLLPTKKCYKVFGEHMVYAEMPCPPIA